MNVTFLCPGCERAGRVELRDEAESLVCPACGVSLHIPEDALDDGQLTRCLVCPSSELFVRKDFPQRLGVAIVVVGFAASCVTWYFHLVLATFGVLFFTATIDLVLFFLMGESLTCYACGAEYRGMAAPPTHGAFDLATHEKHRQRNARLADKTRHEQFSPPA